MAARPFLMPEHVTCNLCGTSDARPLYRLRDYRLRVDDHEWQIVRCRRCGLGYLNPRPAPEEVSRYYPSSYFAHRPAATERYERLAAHVPGPPRRLLDVGTAGGEFLRLMRERAWDVEGIERPGAALSPPDMTIHRVHFPEESPLPDASFDVVTAWAVFEHLHDPDGAFRECARMLKPGGSLLIQVPNLRSLQNRVARHEDVPRHLYFFSPPVLRRYGERHGLELERVAHTTNLFGGGSSGALQRLLVRAAGRSDADYFGMLRLPRDERLRTHGPWTLALAATKRVERALLPDALVRALRVSGQIVATYRRR